MSDPAGGTVPPRALLRILGLGFGRSVVVGGEDPILFVSGGTQKERAVAGDLLLD